MKNSNFWFSIVEIIITVAILIILWVVATTSYQSVLDKSNNSLVESHLQTLKNTFLWYATETKLLPLPSGNLKFYNIDGAYEHNYEDENTFWVSWYITSDIIPKAYLQTIPIDPRNNQYYAYGQTKKYDGFQVSWVVLNHHEPQAKLISNWEWVSWESNMYIPFLVKEYNGPRFIVDNSLENFPYNPEERLLTAKIQSYTWSVSINWQTFSQEQILNSILKEWDKVKVWVWGYVDIYYSDWSYSVIWDTVQESEIQFTQMRYLEESNLFTHVRVMLNAWSIWTKAAKLADKSEFEVETSGAVAAVRWTIFWITKANNSTNIILKEWKIEVLLKQNNELLPFEKPWITTLEDGKSYIIVHKLEPEKWLQIPDTTWWASWVSSWTGSMQNIPIDKKKEFLEYITPTQIEEKVWETTLCEAWWEKLTDECVEFIQEDAPEIKTATGKALFQLYQDVLQRKPDRKWFEYWIADVNKSWINSIKLPFKIAWYHLKLNGKEKYFNPEYICEAQQSFKLNLECVNNVLFKDDLNWKVVGFSPFDEDVDMWSWDNLNWWEKVWSTIWYVYSDDLGNAKKLFPLWPTGLAIFQLWEVKGLFLNRVHEDDFLIYNPSWKITSSSWSFAIEMNVRGQALKRRDANYRLFSNTWLDLEKNNIWWVSELIFNFQNNKILIEQEQLNKLSDTEFYKVIAWYDWVQWFLKIFDNQNKLNLQRHTLTWFPQKPPKIDSLHIASSLTTSQRSLVPCFDNKLCAKDQWNDIIDYVKIYTK